MTMPKFKDCYEALRLLAKVKQQTGDKYEAMAHFKRCIELNPQDFKASFEIAQMFDNVDQPVALMYYEQGLKSMNLEIEKRHKLSAETLSEEDFYKDTRNIVPPELLNNVGVLRLEAAQNLKFTNPTDARKKSEDSLKSFQKALHNIELLQKIQGDSNKF
jgi:tetratricopeptide (TPR) repeat protein